MKTFSRLRGILRGRSIYGRLMASSEGHDKDKAKDEQTK